MKQILTLIITLFSLSSWGQEITSKEWQEQSSTNIRLLPKYGRQQKTAEQKQSDEKFVRETMQQEQFKGSRTAASNHLIKLGFNYLYQKDLKTAMYRFNQAFLLDTANTEIYWGYGAVYMTLGEYSKAREQYEEGLKANPKNTHLLTDFGTYFMVQYYEFQQINHKNSKPNLDSAIIYMAKSYQLNNRDQNTSYKLSVCYWLKDDCNNAWKYYDECKAQGGRPITVEYTADLNKKCLRKK